MGFVFGVCFLVFAFGVCFLGWLFGAGFLGAGFLRVVFGVCFWGLFWVFVFGVCFWGLFLMCGNRFCVPQRLREEALIGMRSAGQRWWWPREDSGRLVVSV